MLHLVGSPTDEFFADLSRLYARDCLEAVADPARYEPHIAYVAPDGRWRFPHSLDPVALAEAIPVRPSDAIAHLERVRPTVAVPQMFCADGMTTYRGLLDVLRIPYVGNRPDVMALGMHKGRTKAVVAAAGVRVPESITVRRGDAEPDLAERLGAGTAVVVKPVDADNSVGVALVREQRELEAALTAAFAHSDEVLVERYVELGREVRCGVLERDGRLHVLPLEEYAVDPATKPVRDAADKIVRRPDGELSLVAKDADHAWLVGRDDPITAAVAAAACAAHRALGCRHYSLFDFRIDPLGTPWFLEAGLYCSFARASVVAVMAAADGIGVPDLFAGAVAAATGG